MLRFVLPYSTENPSGIVGGLSLTIPSKGGLLRGGFKVTVYREHIEIDYGTERFAANNPYYAVTVISRKKIKRYGFDIYGKFFSITKTYNNENV
jgi:hypothetical protein